MSDGPTTEMPRILLLGAAGQLGRELCSALGPLGEVVPVVRRVAADEKSLAVDLADPEALRSLVRSVAPRWIVNAAAYTAVDRAEAEANVARAVNEVAPGILAQEAARGGAGLIHYSTEYVFDGSGERPWREDDPIAPLNVYGRTKAGGEAAIRSAGCPHWILRTSWLYGRGLSFVTKMLDLAERDEISVVDDQAGAPTSARFVAATTAELLLSLAADPQHLAYQSGTLHVACGGETTWHGFAQEIFRLGRLCGLLSATPAVRAVPSSQFAAAARRPLNSRLDTRRLSERVGHAPPDWKTEFTRVFPSVCEYHSKGRSATARKAPH